MAETASLKVGIVGAGVAGLSCARELERGGAAVDVFEAALHVGGRVRTEDVEGHQLDVGFQILLDGYPEVRRGLDLGALGLRRFAPGAVLASGGHLDILAHPLKCPWQLPQTVRTAVRWGLISSCLDVLRLLRLALGWLASGPYDILKRGDASETTEAFLRRLGLSEAMVQRFLRPFFEAIYVAPLKEQSAVMFQFVLRMLALGGACLPARGLRAVPEQLAAGLRAPVRLGAPVEEVSSEALKVGGQWCSYDAVVVAADWPAAGRLLKLPAVSATRSSTWYFSLPAPAPVREPLIVLQSYGDPSEPAAAQSRVVNVGFPSSVQPSYAPAGRELAAVTVMGARPEEAWVRGEVERILGVDCSGWRHLRTYDIAFHQPSQSSLQALDSAPLEIDGVWCCGDHRMNPTLDGAMRSGRCVAEAILRKVRS
mmetsp:Transcript_103096/g.300695  ORF Transcript_103096/g.300695 Transcript_103096/m.300695 type:complete len:426 (-) Transcript_103096:69-1346(-)